MGTATLNVNILKTENQGDAIIELTDSGVNGGVIFSGVTSFNDSASFNSIVNFSSSSSLNLQDSSIPISKLQVPNGTPSSSTYLRGDGTWSTITLPSTSFAGGVGSYVFAICVTASNISAGSEVNGSTLRYNYTPTNFNSGFSNDGHMVYNTPSSSYPGGGSSLSGTWRKVGGNPTYADFYYTAGNAYVYKWSPTLWVRTT